MIIGGESGPGARPMEIAWAEAIVDQCRAVSVPVFVKQLGTVTGGRDHHEIDTFPDALQSVPTPPVLYLRHERSRRAPLPRN